MTGIVGQQQRRNALLSAVRGSQLLSVSLDVIQVHLTQLDILCAGCSGLTSIALGNSVTSIGEDDISKIFPRDNMIVTLYDNKDADKVERIASLLEKEEKVESIISYPTTIGKQVDSKEMASMVEDYVSDMDMNIDESLLNILYYDYHQDGKLPTISIGELINFIANDIVKNDILSKYLNRKLETVKKEEKMEKYDTHFENYMDSQEISEELKKSVRSTVLC